MKKTAVLFPGQGAQEKNMTRDLAEADRDIMEIWRKAEKASGLELREIYWDGDEEAMKDTRALQPALTAANMSIWHALSKKLAPAGAAGHSLGEFSALAAAGVLSLDDVLKIVALRGRLMAEADAEGVGTMSAILKMTSEAVHDLVKQTVECTRDTLIVANHNTPGQFVISGTKKACAHCCELAKANRGRAIPLAVSGAFHSPLMAEAARELEKELDRFSWRDPAFPVYCNASGVAVRYAQTLKTVMKGQMTSPVLWIDTVKNQHQDGINAWIEAGPKAVLSKMIKPILAEVDGALPDGASPDARAVTTLEEIRNFS